MASRASIVDRLFAVPLAGRHLRRLTDGLGGARHVAVSPDGSWPAWWMLAPDRLAEIWLISSDSAVQRPVTSITERLRTIEGR
jgi:Tol biopolymer transport system component